MCTSTAGSDMPAAMAAAREAAAEVLPASWEVVAPACAAVAFPEAVAVAECAMGAHREADQVVARLASAAIELAGDI